MTVLVGYTSTSEGEAALRHGRDIAEWKQVPLNVFVLDDIRSRDDAVLAAAEAAGATVLERDSRDHHMASELLDTAAETDAGFIVIGIRSRSRVGKFLLGSDAQTIILGARIPVLTVKGNDDDDR